MEPVWWNGFGYGFWAGAIFLFVMQKLKARELSRMRPKVPRWNDKTPIK